MKDAKQILSSYLSSSQLLEAGEINDFFTAWEKIAGANLAAHSRIKELEKGIVYVETDHPGWIQLLKIEEKRMVKTLQQRFPGLDIKGIRFFLRSVEQAGMKNTVEPIKKTISVQQEMKNDADDNTNNDNHEESAGKKEFLQSIKRLEKLARDNPRD